MDGDHLVQDIIACPVIRLLPSSWCDLCSQVNTEQWALEHLEFLQSILSPFLEGYWNTTVALLQMESTMEGM